MTIVSKGVLTGGGNVFVEVLQRAWFTLGFIVFVISWMWQDSRYPEQDKITKALTSAVIAAAAIAILFLVTSKK